MLGFMRFTGIPTNYNPVVDILTANNAVFNEGDLITFDASAVDLDGTIVSAVWSINGVDVETEVDPTALQYQTNQLTAGSYTASITVTDDEGATTSASISFVVQSVSSVAGLGVHEATPTPFYGNDYGNATGIRIDGLIFDQDPNGLKAPASFIVAPVISVAGTRSNGRDFRIEDYDIRYELTLADGTALAYDDIVIDAIDGGYQDYNKDFGVTGFFPVDFADDFKLTVTVRAASSTMGMVWKDTYEYTYTSIDHTGERKNFDVTNGNTANDGLDMLGHTLFNGVGGGLTDATYTESTGYLTQTGAFEGVTFSDSARPYTTNRWMWLVSENAYVYIAEKIDNNTVRIDDRYKLGTDATNVTSSKGAKAESDFATESIVDGTGHNKMLFLNAPNGEVYNRSERLVIKGVWGHTGVVGVSGVAEITADNIADSIITGSNSASSPKTFDNLYLGNLKINGQGINSTAEFLNTSNQYSRNSLTLDNVYFVNSSSLSCFNVQPSNASKDSHVKMRGGLIDNKWTNEHTYTLATANSGEGTVTINESIDSTVLQHSIVTIEDGGDFDVYLSASWTGSVFTLEAGRGSDNPIPPATLSKTYSANAVVKTYNPKSIGVFGFIQHWAFRGVTWDCDGLETTFDHPFYPSGKLPVNEGETAIHYFCDNLLVTGSRHINYFMNLNNDTGNFLTHFNESRNKCENGSAKGFFDASSGTNGAGTSDGTDGTLKQGQFTGVYRYGNVALGCDYPFHTYTLVSCTYKANKIATSYNPTSRPFVSFDEGDTNERWPDYDWDWVILDNKAYNYRAFRTDTSNETDPELANKYLQKAVTFAGNEVIYLGTEGITRMATTLPYADQGVLEFTNNRLSAQNEGATPFTVDDTDVSLAAFNTAVGGTNVLEDFSYADPLNGDFTEVVANQPPVVAITTADASEFTIGSDATFDAIASDSDGSVVSAVWAIDGVDVETETDVNVLQYVDNAIASGTHTATITVTDDGGLTGSDSITFTISGAASPQVLTYDPAKPIYQTITDSNQSTNYYTQSSEYDLVKETEMISNGSAQRFFDGAASGGYNASYAWAGFNATGQLVLFNTSGCTIDGTSYADGDDISALIDDGLTHTVIVTVIGTKRLGAIGIAHDGGAGYAGKTYSTAIVNHSDSSVIASFAMDEIKLNGDTEISNGIVMTHHNTTGADWSSR